MWRLYEASLPRVYIVMIMIITYNICNNIAVVCASQPAHIQVILFIRTLSARIPYFCCFGEAKQVVRIIRARADMFMYAHAGV